MRFPSGEKSRFLLRNLFRGLVWLTAIVAAFVLFKKFIDRNYLYWLQPLLDKPILVYLVFYASEQIFGLIPPEIFMIWGLRNNLVREYIITIFILTAISYVAGILGYLFGRYLHSTRFFQYLMQKAWKGLNEKLHRFGPLLIIVASLTPLPYSGTCMLVGSVKFPWKKFLLYTLSRIVRFAAYAPVIWEANVI